MWLIGIFFLAAILHSLQAQDPPILMVNKTNCTVEVYAVCGTCPTTGSSVSPAYFIAPHSFLLYSELSGNGCSGPFMYFKISIPTTGGSIGYQGAFTSGLCVQSTPCTSDIFVSGNDHPCLMGDARISGEYIANSAAGSDCHIVLEEE